VKAGRLELRDLAPDGREQPLPFRELPLDRLLLRCAFRHDGRLRGASLLQPQLLRPDLALEALHLGHHLRVLRAHSLDHVDPREQVVEALGAEHDLHDPAGAAVDVELSEPGRDARLCGLQTPLGDDQMTGVRLQVAVDASQLDGGAVVRLDGPFELHVHLLDLREDRACLGLFRGDGRVGRCRCDSCENRCRSRQEGRYLSHAEADQRSSRPGRQARDRRGAPVTSRGE
jgi:hypothetical protein